MSSSFDRAVNFGLKRQFVLPQIHLSAFQKCELINTLAIINVINLTYDYNPHWNNRHRYIVYPGICEWELEWMELIQTRSIMHRIMHVSTITWQNLRAHGCNYMDKDRAYRMRRRGSGLAQIYLSLWIWWDFNCSNGFYYVFTSTLSGGHKSECSSSSVMVAGQPPSSPTHTPTYITWYPSLTLNYKLPNYQLHAM
jgi:hypothetical protein